METKTQLEQGQIPKTKLIFSQIEKDNISSVSNQYILYIVIMCNGYPYIGLIL